MFDDIEENLYQEAKKQFPRGRRTCIPFGTNSPEYWRQQAELQRMQQLQLTVELEKLRLKNEKIRQKWEREQMRIQEEIQQSTRQEIFTEENPTPVLINSHDNPVNKPQEKTKIGKIEIIDEPYEPNPVLIQKLKKVEGSDVTENE